MTTLYYRLRADGTPVPCAMTEWSHWMATADRHVADTRIGDVRVSTVFLGLDHNFNGRGRPILWETLVFGGGLDGEMYRYGSRDEAVSGHDEMCARVRGETT